jgi:hypothetical protein
LEGHSDSAKDFAQRHLAFLAGRQRVISEGLRDIESVIAGRAAVRIGRHGGCSPLDEIGVKANNAFRCHYGVNQLIVIFSRNIVHHFVIVDDGINGGRPVE